MLRSRKLTFAPLLGLCLAALAGCSNPPIAPEAPKVGAPVAGSSSVIQPQTTSVAAGRVAPVVPALPSAGSAAVVAGSSAAVHAGTGGSAAGAGGAAAGSSAALAGSGGAGGTAGSAVGGSGGAAGSDDSWLPTLGDDTSNNATPPAAGSCSDLFCFDVFDCAIFHLEESATCNFTACENFVCK